MNMPASIPSALDSTRKQSGAMIAISLLFIAIHPFFSSTLFVGLSRIDDVVLLLMYVYILYSAAFNNKIYSAFFYILSWALLLITASLLFGRNRDFISIVLQGFLQTKFFIFCGFALIFVSFFNATKILWFLIIASIIGAVFNLIAPDFFHKLGLAERYRLEGLSVARIGGLQLNANRLGRLLALIPLVGPHVLNIRTRNFILLLFICAILLYFTGSRVSQALFVIGSAYYWVINMKHNQIRKAMLLIVGAPILVAALLIGSQNLRLDELDSTEIVGEEAPAFRVVLLLEGAKLAASNFPIGTGLATYGTPFAQSSSVYEETSISDTFFFNQGVALYDNNFASILGETGWFGIILIILAYRLIIDRAIAHTPMHFRVFFALNIVVIMLFESLMQNAITSACIALALAAISGYHRSKLPAANIR